MKKIKKYKSLFSPKSIAIVGASNKKGKIGNIITENILKLGYEGKTYFVNPAYKILKMRRCYASLGEIKDKIDLAIVCVPAKFVLDVVNNGSKNVRNFVIISAGFSESGPEGVKREKDLLVLAKKYKINILGPNCLGFIVPKLKINASFASGMPKNGNISFVSQSGALAVALMDKSSEENLGFSNIISVGNQMQINEIELLEYLAEDRETKVIGMYLEGIKDGIKFLEKAREVSVKKPIVILKAGKTEKSQQAISSHTGALAGSDDVVNAVFESAGIIRAYDLNNFFDLLKLISFTNAPRNNTATVVTNAGGAGVLTTDAFKGKDIFLAELNEKIKTEIRKNLPEESAIQNPIDLLGDAKEDRYENVINLIKGSDTGSILCLLTPQEQTPVENISKIIIKSKKSIKLPIVAVFIGGKRVKKAISYLEEKNIPNFSNPEDAVRALDQYYKWDFFRKNKLSRKRIKKLAERRNQVAEIIAQAYKQKRGSLFFSESANVMKRYGIKCSEFYEISNYNDFPKNINYPIALKVDSDKILHKSDKQALILNIGNRDSLNLSIKKLQDNFPGERLIIQPMKEKQIEIILGIKKDLIFGPIIIYGLGGIYTEIFKMVDFLVPPMDKNKIKEKLLQGKISFLFKGARGKAVYNIDEFSEIVKSLMDFSLENKQIKEFDINPLLIYNDGRKAFAVDVKIII
ncbi:MAG TPA: acetate--CoA ligase family protein [Candidatus Moranbacteria bacterium]|nr:acetate--CoA ligase family protein [Candidatus Moranbacteria bacterium]HRZ33796.1 acetate--CoA ligase family protein [Candidatus Moranbacteria bacterium]